MVSKEYQDKVLASAKKDASKAILQLASISETLKEYELDKDADCIEGIASQLYRWVLGEKVK